MKKFIASLIMMGAQFLNVNSNPRCRWLDEGVDCVIECLETADSFFLSSDVLAVYNEFTDCHPTGVKLIIPKEVTGLNLASHWLTAKINMTELEIDAIRIMFFDANVFSHESFAKVKKLKLKNVRFTSSFDYDISKNIFHGLNSLEDLMIINSAIKIGDNGWLDNINGTIKSLILTGMGQELPLIAEKLTGVGARLLTNLEYVKIQYSMNSINATSFTSIPNVRELDLSDCGISIIGESSFQTIGSKLQILNLAGNRLTTLPVDIFSSFSLSSLFNTLQLQSNEEIVDTNLKIRLSGNPWNCDCTSLATHLKDLLIANTNFDEDISCATPEEIMDYPIRETEFCPIPITTTEITTEPTDDGTTEDTATDPIDGGSDDIEKECSSYNNDAQSKIKISIEPSMQRIVLNGTSEGVSVMLEKHSVDLLLIWFKTEKFINDTVVYYQNGHADADCRVNLSNPIRVNDLEKDTSYTFCLMNLTRQTLSPSDCISYYNQGKEEILQPVWLYAGSKPLTISLIVVACIVNIIVGVIIGAIVLKFSKYDEFSFRLAFQCWKVPKHEAINSHLVDNLKNKLNPSVNQFTNDLPLPPIPPLRPISSRPLPSLSPYSLSDSDDEDYYAIVK